jgi:hypothetical protein
VVTKTPYRPAPPASSSSALSGISAQAAMAMNETAIAHLNQAPFRKSATQ